MISCLPSGVLQRTAARARLAASLLVLMGVFPFAATAESSMTRLEVDLGVGKTFLEWYASKHQGKWPDSWSLVKEDFDRHILWSADEKRDFMMTYALLPSIMGRIKTRAEGEFTSTLVMVMSRDMNQENSEEKKAPGRWAIWKTNGGVYVRQWHPEAELKSFSAWEQVEAAIKRHDSEMARMYPGSTEMPGKESAFDESKLPSSSPADAAWWPAVRRMLTQIDFPLMPAQQVVPAIERSLGHRPHAASIVESESYRLSLVAAIDGKGPWPVQPDPSLPVWHPARPGMKIALPCP